MKIRKGKLATILAAMLLAATQPARADITVGVSLSSTGPGAALGRQTNCTRAAASRPSCFSVAPSW